MFGYLRKYFVFFLLFIFSVGYGKTIPCPGEFGVAVEWLYMQPAYDLPYFGTTLIDLSSSASSSKTYSTDNHFHSGYRLGLIYSFCNCLNDLHLRWTHFPSFSDTTTLRGNPVLGESFPGQLGLEISKKDTFDFYYLDLLLGWKTIDCCPFLLTLQGGLQFSHLEFKESTKLFDSSRKEELGELVLEDEIENRSRFWGVGPELGADLNYCFWNCFSLTARTYGSLLIGKRNAHADGVLNNEFLFKVENENYWYVVPFANARLGLSYSRPLDLSCFTSCLGCVNFDIEIGYETNWLFNSINRIEFTSPRIAPPNQLMSFSLQGPYVHAGFTF